MYFTIQIFKVTLASQMNLFLTQTIKWASPKELRVHTGTFCINFKDFSRTSKRLSYGFQGLQTDENTDF